MARLDEYLTAAEFDALERVYKGSTRPISKVFSDRLLELGYIQESFLSLVITDAGQDADGARKNELATKPALLMRREATTRSRRR
jgi:hypothetical protein